MKKSESVIEYNIELSVYAAKAAIYAPGGFYERQSGKHSFNADFKYDGYRHACLYKSRGGKAIDFSTSDGIITMLFLVAMAAVDVLYAVKLIHGSGK